MKFEGSLDAFSLPDIFQLLSFTKKSGGLRLRHGRAEGVVWFLEGVVTGATSDVAHQALARRIAGSGLASAEAFRAAVELSASTGGTTGVASALIQAEAVDPDALRTIVAAQATDAVSELLRWPTGDFGLVEAANPDDIGVLIPTETLVSEAISRGAAWESLAEILPSPDVVLALRPVAPEEDVVLKPDEWSLVALVDGRRSVGTIVALTGRGQFSVASALANLVRRGLLHQRGAQDAVADLEAPLALLVPLEASAESLLESLASSTPDETDSWAVTATAAQPEAPTAEQPKPASSGSGLFSTPVPAVPAPADTDHDVDEVDDLPVTSMTLALTKVGGDPSTDEAVPDAAAEPPADSAAPEPSGPAEAASSDSDDNDIDDSNSDDSERDDTDSDDTDNSNRRHRQRRHRRRRGRRGR